MVDAGTTFGGQQLATTFAGADSAVAGRTHRAIGAGVAAGLKGGARSAIHGGDPEDVLVAAGLNAGIAAATELIAAEGASEEGADRTGEAVGGSGGRSAGDEFRVELETTRGPTLAMGKVYKAVKWCRKNKDCRDFATRRTGETVQDGTIKTVTDVRDALSSSADSQGSQGWEKYLTRGIISGDWQSDQR